MSYYAHNMRLVKLENHDKRNIQPTAAPVSGKKPPPSRCALSRWAPLKGEVDAY